MKFTQQEVNTFANDVIEIFEEFLESKGIEIDNDEKIGDDCASNIYGSDYGDLKDEIEYLLEAWDLKAW